MCDKNFKKENDEKETSEKERVQEIMKKLDLTEEQKKFIIDIINVESHDDQ